MAAALELFPIFARAHVLRTWGGIVDVSPDASPIIGRPPVDGLLPQLRLGDRRLQGDAGLGLGARPRPSPTASRTRWQRPVRAGALQTGALIDEHGAAAVAH